MLAPRCGGRVRVFLAVRIVGGASMRAARYRTGCTRNMHVSSKPAAFACCPYSAPEISEFQNFRISEFRQIEPCTLATLPSFPGYGWFGQRLLCRPLYYSLTCRRHPRWYPIADTIRRHFHHISHLDISSKSHQRLQVTVAGCSPVVLLRFHPVFPSIHSPSHQPHGLRIPRLSPIT